MILNIIPKIARIEQIDQCTSERLATGLCAHDTDVNCIAKALNTELTLKL